MRIGIADNSILAKIRKLWEEKDENYGSVFYLCKKKEVIAYANAKINLGLHIIRKRDDGFHDLESVFYPVPLFDILEVIKADKEKLSFGMSGISVDGDWKDNSCWKAFELMQERFGIGNVRVHLHKRIPVGSGLGEVLQTELLC